MLTAAADQQGGHGVQCWVRRESQIHVVSWRVISPLMMLVVTTSAQHAFLVTFVGHAPHEFTPKEQKDEFGSSLWSTVGAVMQRHPDAFWSFLLDANARVGSQCSDAIGPCFPEQENDNGSRPREFAERHHLVRVNIFQ